MKIKKLLKELIKTQNEINKNLEKLNENKTNKEIEINGAFATINSLKSAISTNIYTKEETLNIINKECDYRDKYSYYENNYHDSLRLVEKYFDCKDKYEVLELCEKICLDYAIKKI